MKTTLVLASASRRRRALLEALGIELVVRPVAVDETPEPSEPPEEYVLRMAKTKAAATGTAGELILAADTIVSLDGEILGKPRDPDDACQMLDRLSGRRHHVLTAVALEEPTAPGGPGGSSQRRQTTEVVRSEVELAPLSDEEISWYVATGEPMDKAGSYAIQGLGGLFVETVVGNYTNVVGLPLPTVYRLLKDLGHNLRDFRVAPARNNETPKHRDY